LLIIKAPKITIDKNNAILSADININGIQNTMWYSAPIEYKEYLCYERSDAFVVSLLLLAMEKGENIKCEQDISEKLFFSLTKYLIPFLCKINPSLKKIQIICETTNEGLPTEGKVGTGISCGVDSLSTILYHGKGSKSGGYTINYLTLFNSGYYGYGDDNKKNFQKYLKQSIDFSQKYGYPLLVINSNISNFTKYDFLAAHTYLTCSVVLAMQKFFNVYYYASGYSVFDFKAVYVDSAYYDIFLLDCISTENIKFVSAGTTMRRSEKIELLLNNKEYLKHLYVCTAGSPPLNCGKCEKCVRTLLVIDSVGYLDIVSSNFDIKTYKSRRSINISTMLVKKKNNNFYREIYESFKKNNINIPFTAYLYTPISYLNNRVFTRFKSVLKKSLSPKQIELLKKVIDK
jgi:hypothetical protein